MTRALSPKDEGQATMRSRGDFDAPNSWLVLFSAQLLLYCIYFLLENCLSLAIFGRSCVRARARTCTHTQEVEELKWFVD